MANNGPHFSERLWSEEVGIAEAGLPQGDNLAYRFSNGRTFAEIKYDTPVPPPAALDMTGASRQAQRSEAAATQSLLMSASVTQRQIGVRATLVTLSDAEDSAASTRQGQSTTASAELTVAATVAASQPQTVAAQGALAGSVAASTRQGQRSAAQADASTDTSTSTLAFSTSTAAFANPERGWSLGTYDSQSAAYYTGYRESAELVTFTRQLIDLGAFRSSAISQTFLNGLITRFNALRSAGMKCALRFVYDQSINGVDAPVARVLAHIAQLTPFVQQFADVITVWEAGFVGGWGEWAYSTNFGTINGSSTDYGLTAQQWADRKAVVDAILGVLRTLPYYRCVTLRTPNFKRQMYGTASIADADRFDDSDIARIGFYNDAFSTNPTDMGTYLERATEYAHLQQDTKYTPFGGEPEYSGHANSQCSNAMTEMAALHMSYCNFTYNVTAINLWKSGGCYPNMTKRLGYRLRLTEATLPNRLASAGSASVGLTVVNDGFAAPMSVHPVSLVLRHRTSGAVAKVALAVDCRDWLPGTHVVTETVALPTLAAGTYDVLLALEDEAPTLAGNPLFSIQLANVGVWEAATGFNSLGHAVTVPA